MSTRKFFVIHQKFSKIFQGSSIFSYNISEPLKKPSGPPSYMLNARSLSLQQNKKKTKYIKTLKDKHVS